MRCCNLMLLVLASTQSVWGVDLKDCAVGWNGPDYLVKLDQPVLFKHTEAIVMVAFHAAPPEPPATNHLLMEGFVVKPDVEAAARISGQVVMVPGPYGPTYSQDTGCTFDLGLFDVRLATPVWGDYIVLKSWAKDLEKIAHMNYVGDRLDQFEIERLKPFLATPAGSFKPKRKLWMNRDGQLFEGDYHSQNETHAIVYGLNGEKYSLDKSDLSMGDQLFLERCQYGQFDMRDYNSRPHHYLPPEVLAERKKQSK